MDRLRGVPGSVRHAGFLYYAPQYADAQFLDLLVSFPAPLILAILLYEMKTAWFKKLSQTILYIPHFISWVIIGGIAAQVFGTQSGMINNIITSLGYEAVPFLTEKNTWLITYLVIGVWQSAGWGTIIYLAALTGINKEPVRSGKHRWGRQTETDLAYYAPRLESDDRHAADHQSRPYDYHRL